MDKIEAKYILGNHMDQYRKKTYEELKELLDGNDVFYPTSKSGANYTIEIQVFYDRKKGEDIRVIGAIDDGGWSSIFPMSDSFIMSPDGTFIGE